MKAYQFGKMLMCAAAVSALAGCATSQLLESPKTTTHTTTEKVTLLEDKVVAFGRPTANAGVSESSVVIVGETNSYVLTDGGVQLIGLLSTLDPKNIKVDNQLTFYSAQNDGKFTGKMNLSYAKLQDEFQRSDLQYFLQNDATECTNDSDKRINAQRFCFEIVISGAVYPKVSNYNLVRSQLTPLSRPYSVSIYTEQKNTEVVHSGKNNAQKLVLLPLALAFDVITLPLQILSGFD
ncbi:hypothetical protein [Moraxella marmotae]|uniref:hypothetical protein n=1 Tax=Moraxella marmotae TaxID=3344520 RepID=UPI0035F281AA